MSRIFLLSIMSFFLNQAFGLISIVSAENFYGSVAQELGGPYVQVTNILSSPIQDPHLFAPTLTQAKLVADADLIIYNGLGYDDWMAKLLLAGTHKPRTTLIVSQLITPTGNNPHIWYNPQTMPIYAKKLIIIFQQKEPLHTLYFQQQLAKFLKEYEQIFQKINLIKQQSNGNNIIAAEPLFNDMAHALGLIILSKSFAYTMMNETSPSPKQIQEFTENLIKNKPKVFIYNNQVSSPLIEHLKLLAQQKQIPLMGVFELQPQGLSYTQWMLQNLTHLQEAFNESAHH